MNTNKMLEKYLEINEGSSNRELSKVKQAVKEIEKGVKNLQNNMKLEDAMKFDSEFEDILDNIKQIYREIK